jgi:hypothetical protein
MEEGVVWSPTWRFRFVAATTPLECVVPKNKIVACYYYYYS